MLKILSPLTVRHFEDQAKYIFASQRAPGATIFSLWCGKQMTGNKSHYLLTKAIPVCSTNKCVIL